MTKENNNKQFVAAGASNSDQKSIFLPTLLIAICMGIAFIASLIDKFVYPFGGDLLSPFISQVLILLAPAYLFMMILYPDRSQIAKIKGLGFHRIRAEHVFLIIFTSLFLITTSLVLNICLGGVYDVSRGFTLLGSFTAGVGEFTTSYPYLAIVYAVTPALIEEALFRGLLYSQFSEKDEFFAIAITSVISSAFAFTLGGFPAALLCALTYCFIRNVTGSLFSSVIVHFIFNLYGVFLQTNVAKYFISAQNTHLLIIIVIAAWLISSILFFSEAARIYRVKAERIAAGEEKSSLPSVSFKKLGVFLKDCLTYRPTMICAIVAAVFFVAVTAIGYFA